MANYTARVSNAPKGHEVPPLLQELGGWVKTQEHGALGWFDGLIVEKIPKEWDEEKADRLQKGAFSFLTLGEGSMLALVTTGAKTPRAVALLDSEGDRRTVANSLEEFLVLWSKGETSIDELDDEEAEAGRKALATWLKAKNVQPPKAKDFDFQAWLDGGDGVSEKAPAPAKTEKAFQRSPTDVMNKLGPKVKALANVMGRRVDDPAAIEYVTKTLGKKLPQAVSDRGDSVHVEAPKMGVEMVVSREILNDDYPLIQKAAKSFIPYISDAWVREKIAEPILGAQWKGETAQSLTKTLGEPTEMRAPIGEKKKTMPVWRYVLDTGAHVEMEIYAGQTDLRVRMFVQDARDLEKFIDVSTGIFVAWAATNGLLDESRFRDHADLLGELKTKKIKGSEFIEAAMPRGLWDDHLKDDEELRTLAYSWFHNVNSRGWITDDFKRVFGKREGKHGHDEPKVDDDTWEAVDKASKVLAERFSTR